MYSILIASLILLLIFLWYTCVAVIICSLFLWFWLSDIFAGFHFTLFCWFCWVLFWLGFISTLVWWLSLGNIPLTLATGFHKRVPPQHLTPWDRFSSYIPPFPCTFPCSDPFLVLQLTVHLGTRFPHIFVLLHVHLILILVKVHLLLLVLPLILILYPNLKHCD